MAKKIVITKTVTILDRQYVSTHKCTSVRGALRIAAKARANAEGEQGLSLSTSDEDIAIALEQSGYFVL